MKVASLMHRIDLERTIDTSDDQNIDQLLYGGDNSPPLSFRDVAELALPVVELLDAERPEVVIANDKGSRLFAFAVRQAWTQQHGKAFPTQHGTLDFIRISRDEPSNDAPLRQLTAITDRRTIEGLPAPERVMFLDDWVYTGETIRRFVGLSSVLGISKESITFVTMCGQKVDEDIRHIVIDPSRDPRNSIWNPFPEYTGVDHIDGYAVAADTDMARIARTKITGYILEKISLDTERTD